jgi:pimeloyl-ACP methyl ester carboxylesterase
MQLTAFHTRTHYQRIGNQPKQLVMLHGWGHSFETFAAIIPTLADNYTLIVPDLPAFGQSADPAELPSGKAWDSHTYVSWLSEFLQQTVQEKPFYLLGHSFGGKIAAIYTAQTAQPTSGNLPKPTKLILMDSSGLPLPLTQREQLVQTLAKLTPSVLKSLLHRQTIAKLLQKIGVAADYQQANVVQQAILRQIVREDISSILPLIQTPTTIIWGEQDETTPVSAGKRFVNLIGSAKLHIIPGAGHCPFMDQPAKVCEILEELL